MPPNMSHPSPTLTIWKQITALNRQLHQPIVLSRTEEPTDTKPEQPTYASNMLFYTLRQSIPIVLPEKIWAP